MYVSIKYYKGKLGGYHGGSYTYFTKLELRPGMEVIAPTAKEPRQRGLVMAVRMPKPEFECREITELWTPEEK